MTKAHDEEMQKYNGWILAGILVAAFAGIWISESKTAFAQSSTSTPAQPEKLIGGCSVRVTALGDGTANVVWTADADNLGRNQPTYEWSGTEGLTGSSTSITKRFTSGGFKEGTVIIRAGGQTLPLTCSANIGNISTSTSRDPVGGKCKANPSGMRIAWQASRNGGTGTTTINWRGTDGLNATTSSFSQAYSTEGLKEGTVTIRSGTEDPLELTCQAYVASTTGCFIATAAYGSELEPHVKTLRKFRDEKLLTNDAGRKFVETYYEISPPIADYIRERGVLKAVVRAGLTPIVFGLEHFGQDDEESQKTSPPLP